MLAQVSGWQFGWQTEGSTQALPQRTWSFYAARSTGARNGTRHPRTRPSGRYWRTWSRAWNGCCHTGLHRVAPTRWGWAGLASAYEAKPPDARRHALRDHFSGRSRQRPCLRAAAAIGKKAASRLRCRACWGSESVGNHGGARCGPHEPRDHLGAAGSRVARTRSHDLGPRRAGLRGDRAGRELGRPRCPPFLRVPDARAQALGTPLTGHDLGSLGRPAPRPRCGERG